MDNEFSNKIQCILAEGQRCKEKLSVIGPTGPTGPIGPTGPTGPAGQTVTALTTYGSKYDTTPDTINLTANIDSIVPLTVSGPTNEIVGTTPNTLIVPIGGIYKIDYLFNGSPNAKAELTIEVLKNGAPIGRTSITKEVEANIDEIFTGSAILELTINDMLTLGINSTTTVNVSTASGTNAYLDIIRIS